MLNRILPYACLPFLCSALNCSIGRSVLDFVPNAHKSPMYGNQFLVEAKYEENLLSGSWDNGWKQVKSATLSERVSPMYCYAN